MDHGVLNATDRLKMLSNLYRYNNTLEWIVTAYLSNWGEGDGYFPMPVTDNGMEKILQKDYRLKPDSTCLHYLDEMVALCRKNNIQLVMCVSPSLVFSRHGANDWMKNYGRQHNIATLDFTGDTAYVNHPALFFDATHLNDNGARRFTADFIHRLYNELN